MKGEALAHMANETVRVKRGTASTGALRRGKEIIQQDLLSDEVWVMGCLHLEGAVIRPQVDRIGDASASPFIDLVVLSACGSEETQEVVSPSQPTRVRRC